MTVACAWSAPRTTGPSAWLAARGHPWTDDAIYASQRTGLTDADGRFAFADLAGGEYALAASRLRADALTVTEAFLGSRELTVQIEAGETRSGVRVVLELGDAIEGAVTNEAGEPVPGMLVWLYGTGPVETEADQVTGADGRFAFRGLRPGLYRIEAYPTRIGGETPPYQEASLEVLSGNTAVAIVLELAAMTSGVVVHGDGHPAIKASVVVFDTDRRKLDHAFTDSEGRFDLNLRPGQRVDLLARPASSDGPYWDPSFFPPPSTGVWLERVDAGTSGLLLELPR